jgi:ABC-type lipoprotein export system ATPase subunit
VLNGWAAADRRRRRDELLDLARLSDKRCRYADELSAGQQQRLAVLRAIAHKPKIILMDEPTSCLDTAHAGELMDLVQELCRREQATVLVATHDQAVARRAGSVIGLKDGQIAES